ncbi:3064_t:CDS:1, partial [Racocetra persica]
MPGLLTAFKYLTFYALKCTKIVEDVILNGPKRKARVAKVTNMNFFIPSQEYIPS